MENKQKTIPKFRSYTDFKEHQAYLKEKRSNNLNNLKSEVIDPGKLLLFTSKTVSTLVKKRRENKKSKQASPALKAEPLIQKVEPNSSSSKILTFVKNLLSNNRWIQWQLIYIVGSIILKIYKKRKRKQFSK